jgi:EmrB/QacA subfamily drug resistance transporter
MEPQAMSDRRKTAVLLICSMSVLMVGLDITAVNVALPDIGAQLGAELTWLQWSVSAYTLVMASLLLLAGSTADRLGRKRTLLIGLGVFTFASVLCSVAPTIELLVAARILQGVGASMLNPVAMSIITNTFTGARERAQAVGVWGAVFGVSMALGPILGGALVSSAGWEWIFLINLPLGLTAMFLVRRFVPDSKAPQPRRFDPVGQVLVVVLLASVTYGVIEGQNLGWRSAPIIAAFAAAAASLAGVLRYEPRRRDPLIDLNFFRSTAFSAAIVLSVAAFASFGGFLFLNTLYLQDVRGMSPIEAGLATVPIALMTVIVSPISGRLVGRSGPRKPLVVAGAAFAVSCSMLVGLGPSTALGWLIAAYLVFGIGFGFVNAPITNAAVSGMPRAQAGVAAAVATTSRQFGQAIGVAAIGAIGAASATAAWWTLTALGAVVLALGLVATGGRARRSAQRVATELNPEALAA